MSNQTWGFEKTSEVEFSTSDPMPEYSLIVIGGASLVLLCSGAYLFVRWLRKTEHPWKHVVATCRKALPALQLHGVGLIVLAAGFFLACQLLHDQLPGADRGSFARMAWTCLLAGVGFVVAAVAGRQIAARAREGHEPSGYAP
jgi:hypothetical protein